MCNAKCWLEWCKARRHCTQEQWKCVLWSDNHTSPSGSPDGRIWVWLMSGECYLLECIVPTIKLGRGIMVLGSLGKALSCFSMTMPLCTKRDQYRNGLLRSVCKNLTGLHRALTSTPSNTFGMNCNADCQPDLIAQHQCPTTLMLVAEWKQVPSAMFQHLVESVPRRVEAVIAEKGGTTPY